MQKEPLIIERTYNAPAHKVWDAITNADNMKQWYFNLKDFKPEIGFKFEFNGACDGIDYFHLCEVTEVEHGRKLTYSWRYRDYTGDSSVTWQLFPEGDKTRLVLTHSGIETFPNHKDFTPGSFTEGWNHFLGTALKEFLEN